MSIDPLAEKYYWISPYVYCANNPVKFIDVDGRKITYPNASPEFQIKAATTIVHLLTNGAGDVMKGLMQHSSTTKIVEGKGTSNFNPNANTITWDPGMGVMTNEGHVISPATVLNHEGDHALQELANPKQKKIDRNTSDKDYGNKEEKRVIEGVEQDTAKKLGEIKENEVTRTDHGGSPYPTQNPISTVSIYEVTITPEK